MVRKKRLKRPTRKAVGTPEEEAGSQMYQDKTMKHFPSKIP